MENLANSSANFRCLVFVELTVNFVCYLYCLNWFLLLNCWLNCNFSLWLALFWASFSVDVGLYSLFICNHWSITFLANFWPFFVTQYAWIVILLVTMLVYCRGNICVASSVLWFVKSKMAWFKCVADPTSHQHSSTEGRGDNSEVQLLLVRRKVFWLVAVIQSTMADNGDSYRTIDKVYESLLEKTNEIERQLLQQLQCQHNAGESHLADTQNIENSSVRQGNGSLWPYPRRGSRQSHRVDDVSIDLCALCVRWQKVDE